MEVAAGMSPQEVEVVKTPYSASFTYFSNNPLDRQSELRKDTEYISKSLKSEKARFILFKNQNPLVEDVTGSPVANESLERLFSLKIRYKLKTLKFSNLQTLAPEFGKDLEKPLTIYIGYGNTDHQAEELCNSDRYRVIEDGYFWFAVDVSNLDNIDAITEHFPDTLFCTARPGMLLLDEAEASIAAQAKSVIAWHERYSYCPTCGSKATVQDAGYKRWCTSSSCPSRQGVHNTCFPRVDPATIMVVSSPDGERLLLGRKKVFRENLYSCLAGFLEPGETIEETVRREVREESGIIVGKVEYKFSQPWPFPAVLMIGCFCEALSEEITVCTEELEDARWFSTAEVYDALQRKNKSDDAKLRVPPTQTIAHQLLKHWFVENDKAPIVSKI